MSIARDRANRAGSDPLIIGSSKISANDSDNLVVQDTSNAAKRLIMSEMHVGDSDADKIVIKRNSSTGKVQLQTVASGGGAEDQQTGSVTVYANPTLLPVSGVSAGSHALTTNNNFLYIHNGSGWYKVAEITNATPVISSAGNASYSFATDGTPVSITITASDAEVGTALQYKYTVTSGSIGSTASVTSSATSGGTYSALAVNTLTSNKYFKVTPSTNSAHSGSFSLTFSASDGVNVANSSASSFTLQFSYDIEILLVGGGGSGGKAGASSHQSGGGGGGGVIHSGTYTYTPGTQLDIVVGTGGAGIAAGNGTNQIGNAGSASSVQVNGAGSVFAGSTQFDGNNDNLTISSTNIINSLANFTVEAWAFFDDEAPADEQNVLEFNTGTRIIFGRRKVSSDLTAMYVYSAATSDLFTNDAAHHIVSNRWVHLAWVKEGQNFRMYIDGKNVKGNNNNSATNMAATPSASLITIGENSDGYEPMHGYLSNVRVSSTARYSADFTRPSAAFTNDSDTILLTCQNSTGTITDASSNSYTVTANNGAAANTKVLTSYLALARGGGAGGAGNLMTTNEVGGNGANGGGGYGAGGKDIPGMGYGINGVEVAGFHGANNSQSGGSSTHSGGGGGGAGGDATNNNGANGEGGYDAWGQATNKGEINGGVYRFGAGGGGASYWDYNANSTGGNGGGGGSTNASGQVFTGQDGQANTGGGGGGGGGRAGSGGDVAGAAGAGGSGVVVIRYAGAAKNSQGDSVHTSGGYTYHVYSSTGSATYTG